MPKKSQGNIKKQEGVFGSDNFEQSFLELKEIAKKAKRIQQEDEQRRLQRSNRKSICNF